MPITPNLAGANVSNLTYVSVGKKTIKFLALFSMVSRKLAGPKRFSEKTFRMPKDKTYGDQGKA